MKDLSHALKLSGSAVALMAITSFIGGQATAQTGPDQSAVDQSTGLETVVVTGTNIRGAAPVGENVITMSADDIQQTGSQSLIDVLKDIPALADMGQNSQGLHKSDYFEANIHGIGGSASASTLILIDGMRMPLGGSNHSEPDPSIVPQIAVQRVDVLADGASSVYGADAVAGVINFITRSQYDGIQINISAGYANNYNKADAEVLWGTSWDTGHVMFAYQHAYDSDLELSARQTDANFISKGGLNEDSFNCNPATIQPTGSGLIYSSATSTTTTTSAQANSPCFYPSGTYVPKDTRDSALAKFQQQISKDLTVDATMLYAIRRDVGYNSPGSLTATAFGSGAQANPFYINPPGVTAASQSIRYNFYGLLPDSTNVDEAADIYGHFDANYQLNDNWVISLNIMATQDNSNTSVYGALCSSCALLALNGTTNTGGSTTTSSIPNTTITALNLPLTASNALDVWNPLGSNKTSAQTLAALVSGQTSANSVDSLEQYRLSINGTIFQLPAGPLKGALGFELINNTLIQDDTKQNGTGPTSYGSGVSIFHYGRVVKSAYMELDIPVVSPEMNIPLAEKINLNVSGRYDDYTILGHTANPKYAFDWTVMTGLKFRGSYSTSFVAPQLDSIGDPSQNYLYDASTASLASGTITFPTALYPGTAGVLPGCAATATTCQIGTATVQGISTGSGMGANAKPETGNGYSFGVDFAPEFLPGLSGNVTLWDAHLRGGVQTIPAQDFFNVPSITQYGVIYPNGATPAQVAADVVGYPILSSVFPSKIYYYYNNSQKNIEAFNVQGIDASVTYDFDTDFGHITLGDSATYFLQWGLAYGYPNVGSFLNLLNTDGITTQYPQIQLQSRSHIGWSMSGINVDLFMDYTGAYRNLSSTAVSAPVVPFVGSAITGGDHVSPNILFDAHASYNFADGLLRGDQVYFSGQNIFNTKPPFYNSSTGTDDFVTSLIGRTLTLGFRAQF